jgi:hypothetical protein
MTEAAASEEAAAALIEADKEKMRTKPLEWSSDVAGALPSASKDERKTHMADLKKEAISYEDTAKVEAEMSQDEDLVLNRRHYQKHFKKWEHSDSETYKDAANESYDAIHAEQEGAEDSSGGESAIRFPNPKRKKSDNGASSDARE